MDRKHTSDQVKADAQAIAEGRCPETGMDLSKMTKSQIHTHADLLFPHFDPSQNGSSDYERRARMIHQYAESRK